MASPPCGACCSPRIVRIRRDFAPVSLLGTSPFFLAVNSNTGISTLKDFVAFARARNGSASYGSSGVGSTPAEYAKQLRADIELFMQAVRASGVKAE